MASYLGGTVFSIDTTGNAPPLITGSHTECTEGPGGIGLICIEIPHAHYSYIKFSNAVKAATGATDYPLNLSRFCNVLTCADVNQVRGDLVNTRIEVSQAAGGAVVKAILSVESGHPTLNISLFSDVELTNVELFVEGTILPSGNRVTVTSTAISGGIDFHLAASPPEWLIDIDALIRDAVRARVRDAFLDQARRRAIDDALNSAIGTYASAFVPGFTGFRQVNFVSASGGTLYIDYVPN